ncbi:MAG: nucleotidyltransferase family protein [Bacteroidales bacterium]|nr:nucleotidyltransferase family protein [Bacteroidales bacterium]
MTNFEIFTELMHLGLSIKEEPTDKLLSWMSGENKDAGLREVFQFSMVQGLPSICFDGLQKVFAKGHFKMDEKLNYDWFTTCLSAEMVYDAQQRALSFLANFYAQHGIDMMLLKGYGIADYYPVPKHRPLGDMDIWLFGKQAQADKILSEKLGITVEEDKEHHTVFYLNGIMVENHYEFVNAQSHPTNRLYNEELIRLGKQVFTRSEVGKGSICLPSPTFNALFLFRHMAQHYAGAGINLRHIADWALFLQKEAGAVDWELFLSLAKKTGCFPFWQALMGLTVHYFGISNAQLPMFERDKSLEKKLLNDICIENVYQERVATLMARIKRFKHQRSKIKMVYNENVLTTFIRTGLQSIKYSLKK